jgi:hypothetical protein
MTVQHLRVYSSHFFYSIINFRVVLPVYIPAVWKLTIPLNVHFFFWLLSKNKLLTRDNLGKRRKLDDQSCMSCSDREYVNHIFFECVVTKRA